MKVSREFVRVRAVLVFSVSAMLLVASEASANCPEPRFRQVNTVGMNFKEAEIAFAAEYDRFDASLTSWNRCAIREGILDLDEQNSRRRELNAEAFAEWERQEQARKNSMNQTRYDANRGSAPPSSAAPRNGAFLPQTDMLEAGRRTLEANQRNQAAASAAGRPSQPGYTPTPTYRPPSSAYAARPAPAPENTQGERRTTYTSSDNQGRRTGKPTDSSGRDCALVSAASDSDYIAYNIQNRCGERIWLDGKIGSYPVGSIINPGSTLKVSCYRKSGQCADGTLNATVKWY